MAPKGGKGGGSSHSSGGGGGSSGCSACTAPLQLLGSSWKDGKIIGLFVVEIIAIAVLIVCLVLATRFKWVREAGIDKLRNKGYFIATSALAISYILYVIDTGLRESEVVVTNLYYLLYIFAGFAWRLSDLLILGIILRTNVENNIIGLFRRMPPLHVTLLLVLGALSAAAFGINTASWATMISEGDYGYYRRENNATYYSYVSMAYTALYFLTAILASIEAIIVLLRERSKATFLMVVLVLPCLFIRSLLDMINIAVVYFGHGSYKGVQNLNFANAVIGALASMGIFLGVVLVGSLISRKKRAPQNKEYVGPNYAPVSTYG